MIRKFALEQALDGLLGVVLLPGRGDGAFAGDGGIRAAGAEGAERWSRPPFVLVAEDKGRLTRRATTLAKLLPDAFDGSALKKTRG